MPEHEDRRRTWRVALNLSATARKVGRTKDPVRIVDISTHGCRVEVLNSLSAEATIWLNFGGLEAKQTRVVWCEGGFAGLEFVTPLSEPVLDRLLRAQGDHTEKVVAELRGLASRSKQLSTRSANASAHLSRLSKDCAVYALVHAMKSAERLAAQSAPPQLTSSMIQRHVPDQRTEPGFSFGHGSDGFA
jgi:hypothetical protein